MFTFQFRRAYAPRVEETLYAEDARHVDALKPHDHVVQRRAADRLLCLLCGALLPDEAGLDTHFANHTVTRDEDTIDHYHKAFLGFPEELQLQQAYFDPVSITEVECLVCSKRIKCGVLKKHLLSEEHHKATAQHAGEYLEGIPSTSFMGCAKESEAMQVMEVEEQVEKFIHKLGVYAYCMQCNKPVEGDPGEHCTTVHKVGAAPQQQCQAVGAYHQLWKKELAAYRNTHAKYFIAHRVKMLKCLICGSKVLLTQVEAHIKAFPCGFLSASSPMYEPEVGWEQMKAKYIAKHQPGSTDVAIPSEYYALECIEKYREMDALGVYTIQQRAPTGELFCLLCRCAIGPPNARVFEHAASVIHQRRTGDKKIIGELYAYHKFFHRRDADATLQHLVNPYKKHEMKCARCKRKEKPSALLLHVVNCRFGEPMASGEEQQPKKKEEAVVVRTRVIYPSTSSTSSSDAAKPSAPPLAAKPPPKKVPVPVPAPDVKPDAEDLVYDEATMLTVYPSANTPKGERRPPILAVQTRRTHEKYCLVCNCYMYQQARDHLTGERHARTLRTVAPVVAAYHAFWMSQTPSKQLQQIYFNPLGVHGLECDICGAHFFFAEQFKHQRCIKRMLQLHKRCALGDDYEQCTFKYSREMMRRFFFGAHYGISQDVFSSEIPMAITLRRHLVCLLCTGKSCVQRWGNEGWKRHLYDYHSKNDDKREAAVKRVVEFHEFWSRQPVDQQFYLGYYTIKPDGMVGCERGHVVPLDEAITHIETEGSCPALLEAALAARKRREQEQERAEKAPEEENGETSDAPTKGIGEHIIVALYPDDKENKENENNAIPLPVYYEEHRQHLERIPDAPNTVHCLLCDKDFVGSALAVRQHVGTDGHQQRACVNLKVRYHCEICNAYKGREYGWLNHLDSTEHKRCLNLLAESRKTDSTLGEHYCQRCQVILFGDSISLIRHKEPGGGRREKKSTTLLTDGIKELFSTRAEIDAAGDRLVASCAAFKTASEADVQRCISDLEEVLQSTYPNCKIYQFGSRVAGFVNADSDLDLYVDVDNKYMGTELDYQVERRIVLAVRQLLKAAPTLFAQLHTVLSARVPIAKVVHVPTKLDCDLSFINGLSVENTRLIAFYADYDPCFRSAMLLLKEWGCRMESKLKNDMTSYALCMLLIFRMQVAGHLPSVQRIREMTTMDVANIGGWDTIDYSGLDMEELKATTTPAAATSDVIQGFMKYYGFELEYEKDVVCPLLGEIFRVNRFNHLGAELPDGMQTYQRKVVDDADARFRCTCSMYVQDPFDLGHNLTKNLPKSFVMTFRKLCRLSHDHINR